MEKKYLIILIAVVVFLFFFILYLNKTEKNKFSTIIINSNNMLIASSAFSSHQFIPSKYTCDGENINPPLEIKSIPQGAKSLVLIVDDPDAPGGTFLHWLVFNIDPHITRIEENSIPKGGIEGRNSFGKLNYGGPCTPSGTHRYFFKIYAIDTELNLPAGTNLETVEKAVQKHILEKTELIGLYKKK